MRSRKERTAGFSLSAVLWIGGVFSNEIAAIAGLRPLLLSAAAACTVYFISTLIPGRLVARVRRMWVPSLFVGIVAGMAAGLTHWWSSDAREQVAKVEPAPPEAMPQATKPDVYTGYALVGRIPTEAPRGQSELYVLHVNDKSGKGGLRIDAESPSDPVSPQIYRCIIRNIGGSDLHEVRLEFGASFFAGGKPEGSGQFFQHYVISIPPLKAGDAHALYLRNDSPMGAIVDIPMTASVRATPGGDGVAISLTLDSQNIPEGLPATMLPFHGARTEP
jgi:hypothetical protein